jgi:hypothetical protein
MIALLVKREAAQRGLCEFCDSTFDAPEESDNWTEAEWRAWEHEAGWAVGRRGSYYCFLCDSVDTDLCQRCWLVVHGWHLDQEVEEERVRLLTPSGVYVSIDCDGENRGRWRPDEYIWLLERWNWDEEQVPPEIRDSAVTYGAIVEKLRAMLESLDRFMALQGDLTWLDGEYGTDCVPEAVADLALGLIRGGGTEEWLRRLSDMGTALESLAAAGRTYRVSIQVGASPGARDGDECEGDCS